MAFVKNASLKSNRFLFNADKGLLAWYAALANTANASANIIIYGDSISAGYQATNQYGYAQILKDALQNRFGRGNVESIYYSDTSGVPSTRFVKTVGTWADAALGGFMGQALTESGNTKQLTISNLYGDGIEIYYVRNATSSGTFNYAVDGGSNVGVAQTIVSAGSETVTKVGITGLTLGTHSIVITAPSSGTVSITSVVPTIGTTGVRVYNPAYTSTKVQDWYSTTDNRHFALQAVSPHLFIMAVNTNDFSSQTALATFNTKVSGMVAAAQAVNASVLLFSMTPHSGSLTIPQSAYGDELMAIAQANNCALFDGFAFFQSLAAQLALGLVSDGVHPTDAGHRAIADALGDALVNGVSNVRDAVHSTVIAAGTNTYTATIKPVIGALTVNAKYYVTFTNANSGASTLNLNGLGAVALNKAGSQALSGGEILAGQTLLVSYTGSAFEIIGGPGLGPAAVSDLNTGTENTKPATALALEGSKYLTQSGTKISATASGTNTYAATISPAIAAYGSGQRFFILFTNANTGAATLNLNSLGAKSLVKFGSTALASGDISAGMVGLVAYDGTNFQLLNPSSSGGGGTYTGSDDILVSGSTVSRVTQTGGKAHRMLPFEAVPTGAAAAVDVANTVYGVRVYVAEKLTVASVHYRQSAAFSGGFLALGIYADDGNTKLIDTGAQSTTSGGVVNSITLGATVTLAPGWYWFVWTANNTTATFNGMSTFSQFVGIQNAGTVQYASFANASVAGVLPATLGTATAYSSGVFIPVAKLQG